MKSLPILQLGILSNSHDGVPLDEQTKNNPLVHSGLLVNPQNGIPLG